jgi:hypothetical protein
MAFWYRKGDPHSAFGDYVVICFLIVQCLDGVLTYLGVRIWGPGIEVNPLISSAVQLAGLGAGLTGVKLIAVGFGMALHLHRVHNLVAALTVVYLGAAILPWALVFLAN